MKTERNILIAFILNLLFSIFEFIGGMWTGSVAIISDAVHDFGDATTIGISYFLEKKSKTQADEKYTYGYLRFSVIGSVITTLILTKGKERIKNIITFSILVTRKSFSIYISFQKLQITKSRKFA